MTTPTPPRTSDDYDPALDTPLTRVKIATPWWTRVSAAVLGVSLAVSLTVLTVTFVFMASSLRDGVSNERKNAAFARTIAEANAQATQKARTESECRSQRNADLTRVSSQLVGLTAKLFVRLAQRDPAISSPTDPIYAEFDRLSRQRDLDDAAADRGVEDCRQP